jgi:Protein of unknown function (DUF3224)
MTTRVSGTFDVTLTPEAADDVPEAPALARYSLVKTFHGDLDATSKGEMLSAAGKSVKTSAGYVAIERVTGRLQGRSGAFALQHNGIMNRGTPELTVIVVPDSATGDLEGLAGQMKITIVEGKHLYELEYTLPGQP